MISCNSTHRPGKLERHDDLPSVVVASTLTVLSALELKSIPTESASSSSSIGTVSRGGDLGLVFLQAHFEIRVALVQAAAAAVLRVAVTVAALAAQQLTFGILYGNQLQLEIARGMGHLKITDHKREKEEKT